ncbi:MAG: hypothetical protein FJ304_23880 [Planctomycetes bacterium]|nr:hypothetical protein [Planctomycetota bacterium]
MGFFGPPLDEHEGRKLEVSECADAIDRYNAIAPADLRIQPEEPPRGSAARGIVVASAEGYPIVLNAGVLSCPYLTTHFIESAIGFVAYLHTQLGCTIYSDNEGRALTLDEYLASRSFAEVVQAAARADALAPAPATGS